MNESNGIILILFFDYFMIACDYPCAMKTISVLFPVHLPCQCHGNFYNIQLFSSHLYLSLIYLPGLYSQKIIWVNLN
jgi:hypothetical protein